MRRHKRKKLAHAQEAAKARLVDFNDIDLSKMNIFLPEQDFVVDLCLNYRLKEGFPAPAPQID